MLKRRISLHLEQWKNKKNRKPLVLRGARQVGKTSAVLDFGFHSFEQVIHLNLEKSDHIRLFRNETSVEEFIQIIEVHFEKKIIPGKTLIFIDEIQHAPNLIKLLRFFYEERNDIHVIAAGSLMDVILEKLGFSFPVGRVEFAYMYPLDFFEFLEAKEKYTLRDYLRNVSLDQNIPDAIHTEALKCFYEYTMIGGMPEVVNEYVQGGGIHALTPLYSSLMTSYLEDVYKYSSHAHSKYLSYIIENAPLLAGTLFTYDKFGESSFRSREMSEAFRLLEKIMLLYQVRATKSTLLPLMEQAKRPKKLLFLDSGLVNYLMGIQKEFFNIQELADFYRGQIAEQVVGQNILAQFTTTIPKLYYWAKDKSEGIAEIDFCMNYNGKILGIEVKSGVSNKLRSLYSFAEEVPLSLLMRIYAGIMKREEISIGGKNHTLCSFPFYLIPRCITELSF